MMMQAKASPLSPELGSVEASKSLGVDLFELSRLMAAEPAAGRSEALSPAGLIDFGQRHRIECWWRSSDARNLGSKEQVVRTALGMLIQRGFIGETWTRRDNLWRGLSALHCAAMQESVEVLLDEGLLLARGRHDISVAPAGIGTIHIIASGVYSPPALVEVWGS